MKRIAIFNFYCILFGGIARLLTQRELVYMLVAVSCAFRSLTIWGMALLISRVYKAAADEPTAGRVRTVGVVLVAAYIMYPVVFFAHMSGSLTTVLREQLYAALDVAVKCAATTILLDGFFTLHVLELNSSRAALKSSNTAKAALTAFILQQARVPLQAVERKVRKAAMAKLLEAQDANITKLHGLLSKATHEIESMNECLDDVFVYRSLVIGEMSSTPVPADLRKSLAANVVSSAKQLCEANGLELNVYVQQKLPALAVFDEQRWLQATDALLRRCCKGSRQGSTISIALFVKVQGFALGALQLCILDSSSVAERQLLGWADASSFFERFLVQDSRLSNLVMSPKVEMLLTEGSAASEGDAPHSSPTELARESSEALCMAMADKIAKLLEGSVEVEQLPGNHKSRAVRMQKDIEEDGGQLPEGLLSHLKGAHSGLFSHLVIPVALPPDEHTVLGISEF